MITRLKLSTIEQGLPKYRSMLAGNPAFDPYAFQSIASASGTGSSNTITFSSIPSTYQHLQIRGIARDTDTTSDGFGFWIRFNSDTGSNYARHALYGDGATVAALGAASSSLISGPNIPGSGGTATYVATIIDVHDYLSTTKNKTARVFGGYDKNGAGTIWLRSGVWLNTSAITSITLFNSNVAWSSDTTFALYGIKGA